MAAEVETMFSVRTTPWHGLGTIIEEAPTSEDALRMAGLDWSVVQCPIQIFGGSLINNYKANIRSSDGKVLGIVSDRYCVVQNTEAFAFTDALIQKDGPVRYETAGSLFGGRKIWMLAKLPSVGILGDEIEPYVCFQNTHDGSGSLRACMTPIRVVCNNTLNLAFDGARRQWSTRHLSNVSEKVHEAQYTLGMAKNYMEHLDYYADYLHRIDISTSDLNNIMDGLFPAIDRDTQRKKDNSEKLRSQFMNCYSANDIRKFEGTGWGVINAVSDMIGHTDPIRKTENYRENNWDRIMNGHRLLDRAVRLVENAA